MARAVDLRLTIPPVARRILSVLSKSPRNCAGVKIDGSHAGLAPAPVPAAPAVRLQAVPPDPDPFSDEEPEPGPVEAQRRRRHPIAPLSQAGRRRRFAVARASKDVVRSKPRMLRGHRRSGSTTRSWTAWCGLWRSWEVERPNQCHLRPHSSTAPTDPRNSSAPAHVPWRLRAVWASLACSSCDNCRRPSAPGPQERTAAWIESAKRLPDASPSRTKPSAAKASTATAAKIRPVPEE
jgi:hypothetical protein